MTMRHAGLQFTGAQDIGQLELGDIIDVPAVQSLMDDFHALVPIPMAMIDRKGKVLVGIGWQDICTKFHRVHPESCKFCIESDTVLSAGVPPGEFRLYKCKNHMWDVATPIVVGGQHVGNLFTGQFFFEDEAPDRDLFRAQAETYGFEEKAYLGALDRVPRFSRELLQRAMGYFLKLAGMLSQLSYSNLKLARSVAAREQKEHQLRQLNRTLKALSNSGQALIHTQDESQLLRDVCQIIVQDCGHAMVWVGYAQDDPEKSIRPVALAGCEAGYIDSLQLTWADQPRGQGPTGTCIRTGRAERCRDMSMDPQFAPWREKALQEGYASSLAVPLLADGKAFGAITIYSREPDHFAEDEVKLLTELADDLAYGIGAIRLRAERRRAQAELEKRTLELERTNARLQVEIAERKQAQDSLQRTAEDLKRSNRDLEQFAYVASHDLQEPLRAVGGYVKLLERRFPGQVDAKAREYIAGAAEGAVRMEKLITDLLAYSRVGTQGAALAPADLNELLQNALRNLQAALETAHATISSDRLPVLSVDQTQLTQLFQNLIGNALKFRGPTPPAIKISAQQRADGWVISVRDNGIGIEPQYYDRIFQIFQRLHTRKEYPGTGMGLAICKKIVERHGGSIWVESEPGRGSTFLFSIPERSTTCSSRYDSKWSTPD